MDRITPRELTHLAENQFRKSDLFYGHGTDNPHDEAVYLVLRSLQLPFDVPDTELDAPISEEDEERITRLIDQRIVTRKPVAYLINEAWFAGLPFYVDERVLIPRSPMAELIMEHFSPWIDPTKLKTILDIGTGSGCIAIACAREFPDTKIDAVDISHDALQVAQKNIEIHQVSHRVNLIRSDLFEKIPGRSYDLIIANPPYVRQKDIDRLPAEYHHEPLLGLAAGQDGLDIVERLLKQAGAHLTRSGVMVVEVGNSQEAVMNKYPELPIIWLEFEHGGEGVFLVAAEDLEKLNN